MLVSSIRLADATAQAQASGHPAFSMCFPACFNMAMSHNSATSPLCALFLTFLHAVQSHPTATLKLRQHPMLLVPHHPRHDSRVDRDRHLQNGFQCTAHISDLSLNHAVRALVDALR